MTDEPKVVPSGDGGSSLEPEAVPVPEIATKPSGAGPLVDEDALADRLAEKILPRIQSRTDIYVAGRMKGVGLDVLAKRLGVPVEKLREAEREEILDEVIEQHRSGPTTAPASQPKDDLVKQTSAFVSRLQTETGVGFTPEEIKTLSEQRTYYSDREWLEELGVAHAKKVKQANVGPGAGRGEGGGLPPASPDLQKQFDAEKARIRRGDVAGHVALKQKYREKGLNV